MSAEDFLVIVAVRTNQHNVQRRLDVILSASAPEYPKADAQVVAKDQLTAVDRNNLAALFGYNVLGSLGWDEEASAA